MSSVARRYAKAILAVAESGGTLDKTAGELVALARVAKEPQVAAAFTNPLMSETRRRELADTIAKELGVQTTVAHFVSLLADHQRLDQMAAIAVQYNRQLDEKLHRVRAVVRSATEIDAADLARIVEVFEKKTGKSVLAEAIVDADLLGGVTVDIAGKVYDGSLRTQLENLASSIAGSQSFI